MKEENKQKLIDFSLCLGIVLIFLGMFVITDYTQDSYLCFKETWKEPFNHFLGLGRVFSAIFWLIFSGTNYNIMCTASGILAIIGLATTMYFMKKVICSLTGKKNLSLILSTIIILNMFVLELFVWYEKSVLILSVLACVLAIYHLNKAIENKEKKHYILSFIWMLIANFSYQGTVGIFVSLGTILVIKHSKTIKEFIKNNIIVVLLYGIPAVINYLYIKAFFNTNRLVQAQDLYTKVSEIYRQGKGILVETYDILPKNTFVILLGLVSLIFIVKSLMTKDWKKISLNIFFLVYVVGVNVLATVMPQVFQNYINIVPRNTYSLAALAGIIVLMNMVSFEENKVIEERIIKGMLLVFLIIQWYNFMIAIKDHYTTNYIDKIVSIQIAEEISKYEEETGNIIDTVYTCKDMSNSYMYEGMKPIGEGNVKAFNSTWGIRGILDGVLNRELKVEDSTNEKHNAFFRSKDWTAFDKEQLIFEENTLYLCIF